MRKRQVTVSTQVYARMYAFVWHNDHRRVWEWHQQYGRRIVGQLKSMGAGLDWEREVSNVHEHRHAHSQPLVFTVLVSAMATAYLPYRNHLAMSVQNISQMFTMDADHSTAVSNAFITLHRRGLLAR